MRQDSSCLAAPEVSEFTASTGVRPREGVPSSNLTTFFIGGPLRYVVDAESEETVRNVLALLTSWGESPRVIGAGSNLLIADEGLTGWTIRLGRGFRFVKPLGGGRFEVGGSVSLMSLSRELSQAGWSGLEFAGGIPASLGGAVRMNAGAHGGQMADVLRDVTVALPSGERETLPASALDFEYRKSGLPEGAVVLKATIELAEGDKSSICERRAAFLADRKKAQPLTSPSAGSVFKNPAGAERAGVLIERAGLKGRRHGGAWISEKHGNWIVNGDRRAKASDVHALIELCREEVKRLFGVTLERELIAWDRGLPD